MKEKVGTAREGFSDEEIHTLADWLEGLTLRELFYLRASYLDFMKELKADVLEH